MANQNALPVEPVLDADMWDLFMLMVQKQHGLALGVEDVSRTQITYNSSDVVRFKLWINNAELGLGYRKIDLNNEPFICVNILEGSLNSNGVYRVQIILDAMHNTKWITPSVEEVHAVRRRSVLTTDASTFSIVVSAKSLFFKQGTYIHHQVLYTEKCRREFRNAPGVYSGKRRMYIGKQFDSIDNLSAAVTCPLPEFKFCRNVKDVVQKPFLIDVWDLSVVGANLLRVTFDMKVKMVVDLGPGVGPDISVGQHQSNINDTLEINTDIIYVNSTTGSLVVLTPEDMAVLSPEVTTTSGDIEWFRNERFPNYYRLDTPWTKPSVVDLSASSLRSRATPNLDKPDTITLMSFNFEGVDVEIPARVWTIDENYKPWCLEDVLNSNTIAPDDIVPWYSEPPAGVKQADCGYFAIYRDLISSEDVVVLNEEDSSVVPPKLHLVIKKFTHDHQLVEWFRTIDISSDEVWIEMGCSYIELGKNGSFYVGLNNSPASETFNKGPLLRSDINTGFIINGWKYFEPSQVDGVKVLSPGIMLPILRFKENGYPDTFWNPRVNTVAFSNAMSSFSNVDDAVALICKDENYLMLWLYDDQVAGQVAYIQKNGQMKKVHLTGPECNFNFTSIVSTHVFEDKVYILGSYKHTFGNHGYIEPKFGLIEFYQKADSDEIWEYKIIDNSEELNSVAFPRI